MMTRLAELNSAVNSQANVSIAYDAGMSIDRRQLLRKLIDDRFGGNVAEFSRAIKKAPAQVHQWLSGHRNIGDAGARHIEKTIPGLWQGFFDGDKKPENGDRHITVSDRAHGDDEGVIHFNVAPGPDIRGRIPLISWTTAGNWAEVVDNFAPGDADEWIATTANVGDRSYALRIRGESMMPTIPDGAIVIVDPDAEAKHRSIVIVRQNGDTEATCKRLIYEGDRPMIRPDNPAYAAQILPMGDDAVISGVVRQIVVDLE